MTALFRTLLLLSLPLLLSLSACSPTGDTDTDIEAAQSVMPAFGGYTSFATESVQDAITAALSGGSLATGNIPAAALVAKIDGMIDCYRGVGAVDARVFVQNGSSEVFIPIVGAVAVVNETRVIDNFVNCVASPLSSAQSAGTPEPCTGSGRFAYQGDNFVYIYAGSDTSFCSQVTTHFNGLDQGQ